MWGAGPPATWAFAIFLASDMLFLRLFPGVFGVFAFSQCVFVTETLRRFKRSLQALTKAPSAPYQSWSARQSKNRGKKSLKLNFVVPYVRSLGPGSGRRTGNFLVRREPMRPLHRAIGLWMTST